MSPARPETEQHDSRTVVDLVVHPLGAAVTPPTGLEGCHARPLVPGQWLFAEVDAVDALNWALDHLRTFEVVAPGWFRQWLGDSLVALGGELLP